MTKFSHSRLPARAVMVVLVLVLALLAAWPAVAFADSNERFDGVEADYTVSLADRAGHKWGITAEFRGLSALRAAGKIEPRTVTIHMPVWSPGTYQRSDFGRLVDALYAKDPASGRLLDVAHPRTDTWTIALPENADRVQVSYQTVGGTGWAGGGLRETMADFLGTGIFVYIRDCKEFPATLRFKDIPENWGTFCPLPAGKTPGDFRAVDYDKLADTATVFGPFRSQSFEVAGKTIEIVVTVEGEAGETYHARLTDPVRRIVQAAADMMGGLPFERYVFFYFVRRFGFGGAGLEHDDCTQIWVSGGNFRGDMMTLLNVTAHEFFHLWNVKRLRAAAINPYDYQNLPDIDCLWFHEGVTSYYADVLLARAGLVSTQRFIDHMPQLLAQVNRSRDYYLKGECYGFLLDCLIRHYTKNEKSFDDLFRELWKRYGVGTKPFDQTAEIARVCNEIAGADLSWFFDRHILGGEPVPVAQILAFCGIEFEGARAGSTYWGFDAGFTEADLTVKTVVPIGPAALGGLQVGDIVRSLDGQTVTANWEAALRGKNIGDELAVTVARNGQLVRLSITAGAFYNGRGRIVMPGDDESMAGKILNGIPTGKTGSGPAEEDF